MTFDYTPLEARIDPDTAEDRVAMARERLATLDETERMRVVQGERGYSYRDPIYHYRQLVRAQLSFAEAQVRAKPKVGYRAPSLEPAPQPQQTSAQSPEGADDA